MAGTLADLVVKVGADIKGFEVGLEKVDAKLKDIGRTIDAAGKDFKSPFSGIEGSLTPIFGKFDELEGKFQNIGRAGRALEGPLTAVGAGLTAVGAAGVAGLGLAANAAVDFETAFAGVRKTVEGTPEDFAALEAEIRKLALSVPVSAASLANIAEIAGQLGVEKQNIAAFTSTIAALGVATNLTGEEGAAALARLINVSSATQGEVSNVGSAIVALGNTSATTEAEIANMATRLGLAGTQAGLSTAEVLGFSAALSSAGVSAELGGTNFSKFVSTINTAVVAGGADLQAFAAVAGQSAEDFRASFQDDAAGAITAFLDGLATVSASGGDVSAVLETLGFSSQEAQRAILALSTRTDELRTALDTSTTAFQQNTALTAEAAQRYATTASQLQLFRNGLADIAITVGQAILPALNNLLTAVRPAIEAFAAFAANNPTLTATLVAIGGALSALALAVGPVLIVVGQLAGSLGLLLPLLTTAGLGGVLGNLGGTVIPAFASSVGIAKTAVAGMGAAAVLAAGAFAGWNLGKWAADNIPAVQKLGDVLGDLAVKFLPGVAAEFERVTQLGVDANKGLEEQANALAKALAEQGVVVERGGLSLIEYNKALRAAAIESGAIKAESRELKDEVSDTDKAVEEYRKEYEELIKRIGEATNKTADAKKELKQFEPVVRAASETLTEMSEDGETVVIGLDEMISRAQATRPALSDLGVTAGAVNIAFQDAAGGIAGVSAALEQIKNPTEGFDASLQRLGVTTKATREQELAVLQQDLANLDAALAGGIITQDEYTAAVGRVRDELGLVQPAVLDLQGVLTDLGAGIQAAGAGILGTFVGTGSISEALSGAWQTIKNAGIAALDALSAKLINIASEAVLGKLIGGLDSIIGKGPAIQNILGGLLGLGGGAASAAGGIAGAAGAAGQTASTASSAASAASSGLAGLVTAVSGVVTAITGVIGIFQAARQEGTLNAIELEQRQTKDLLRDQVLPALWFISDTIQFGGFVKTLENARDYLRDIAENVAFGPAVKAAEESREFLRSIDRRLAEGLVAAGVAATVASPAAVASFADGGRTEFVDLTPVLALVQETSAQHLNAQAMLLEGVQRQSELLAQQEATLNEYESLSLQQRGENTALMELLLSEVESLQSPINITVNNPQFLDERQVSAVMDGIARRVRRGVRGV